MAEMVNHLDDLHAGKRMVIAISRDLQELGFSLRHVGNESLARRLEEMARVLSTAADQLDSAASGIVGVYHAATAQGTTNMMSAVLAMASRMDAASHSDDRVPDGEDGGECLKQ